LVSEQDCKVYNCTFLKIKYDSEQEVSVYIINGLDFAVDEL